MNMIKEEEVHISVTVVIEKDGDEFHAYTPALKGLHVDGATQKDAQNNAKEAIHVYLESLKKHREPIPEGPGLTVHKATENTSLENITIPWPLPNPSGINSRTEPQAI